MPKFFETGLLLEAGAAAVQALCVLLVDEWPRWIAWPLLATVARFVGAELIGT